MAVDRKQIKRGATLTGYGLIVGLIAIVGLVSVTSIGDQVTALFGEVGDELGAVVDGESSAAAPTASATPLFSFTSHTFTSCGQTGTDGPSLSDCQMEYSGQPFASDTSQFNITTPGFQTFTIPETGTYRFTVDGAEGGRSRPATDGGMGGRVVGEIDLTQGEVITLVVGQMGEGFDQGGGPINGTFFATGGFNGGGGTGHNTDRCSNCSHASGGGASDVRIGGTALANRVLVAGGGGGGSTEQSSDTDLRIGGDGGGLTGGDGESPNGPLSGGRGGTQSAGGLGGNQFANEDNNGTDGSLGQGGRGNRNDAGGGGGGYFGGGGGGDNGSGGGGSSFADGSVLNVDHTQGANTGDGSITLELLP